MPEINYVDTVEAAHVAYGKFEDEGKAALTNRSAGEEPI